jgi:hypothetical protein
MRTDTLRASDLLNSGRLDSGYHLSAGREAAAILSTAQANGITFLRLGPPGGIAKVWQPDRFKRAYAVRGEQSLPYLRPYDVFEYLPTPADLLSVKRNRNIDSYRLRPGVILQSCSGRNLGPAVVVDRYLAQFLIGDDMLRVEIDHEELRYYVLAFLKTPLAQALLRQGKTGSVIDHISADHVAGLQVPVIPERTRVATLMREGVQLIGQARLMLAKAQQRYEDKLPRLVRHKPESSGWTVQGRKLTGRLDAASYNPLVASARAALLKMGGTPLSELATVLKPGGRYKTAYVSAEHGTPILSGTQLLQRTPVNLQYLAKRSLRNKENYELRAGWLAYQADGRAEETLGLPVMITPDRDGWLASGHVGRVVPNEGVHPGWLCTALRTQHCQIQIKALASGSVVDSTFAEDMASVIVPPSLRMRWDVVVAAWFNLARGTDIESQAVRLVECSVSQRNLHLT